MHPSKNDVPTAATRVVPASPQDNRALPPHGYSRTSTAFSAIENLMVHQVLAVGNNSNADDT